MAITALEGKIVLRHWQQGTGLAEVPHAFHSLEELYTSCLSTSDPELIDRIVIEGIDETGRSRVVTFVFQSITVSGRK